MPESTTYTPRPGSKAEAAIAILQREGWMSNVDLAAELDVPASNIGGHLGIAQREGVVRSVARDGIAGFALGGTGEPVPDGDVAVRAAAQARRPKLRKDQPAPKARQPRSKRGALPAADRPAPVNAAAPQSESSSQHDVGDAIAPPAPFCALGDDDIGVLADGSVVICNGFLLLARIPPEVAARIVAMVERLRQ